MPWKVLFYILFGLLVLALVGFNYEFKSSFSIGLYVFEQVPVLLTVGFSFLAGAVFTLISVVRTRKKTPRTAPSQGTDKAPAPGGRKSKQGDPGTNAGTNESFND